MTEFELQVKKLGQEYTETVDGKKELELEQEINITEAELAKSSITVIVFSAMAVEAYIFDYAARHLGDKFVRDHLDKLDTLSKWIIVPELITGKEMSHNENWQGQLKKLIKVRNSVAHYKSSEPPALDSNAEKYFEKLQAESETLRESAQQAITLLKTLADKIIELDPEETPWVKSYLI